MLEIPKTLIDQLASPGRIVFPMGRIWKDQYLYTIDKDENGQVGEPQRVQECAFDMMIKPE